MLRGTQLRFLDFSSWQSILTTVLGLILITLVGIGIRMVMMMTIQARRERMNRQINERLRTLIAAYKVLGGSFTGNLEVDPAHKRDLRKTEAAAPAEMAEVTETAEATAEIPEAEVAVIEMSPERDGSDRRRRIRDAVEAALSDIILLGTEDQVRLAERAARELVAGHPVHTHELVVSLRDFIRKALDIEPIPADLTIPAQGPARPSGGRGGGAGGAGGRPGGGGGGGGGGTGGMGGGGMGMGMGMGGGRDKDPGNG